VSKEVEKILLQDKELNYIFRVSEAVKNGDTKVIQCLCNQGAPLNYKNNDGNTPLMEAIKNKKLPIVMKLVANPDVDKEIPDNNGATPVFVAAEKGNNPEMVFILYLLIRAGADPNTPNDDKNSPLFIAAKNNNMVAVEELLKYSTNSVFLRGEGGKTPFFIAAEKGNNEILTMLQQKGANLNAVDNYLNIPIFAAVANRHISTVAKLIEMGVNINKKGAEGIRALDVARKATFEATNEADRKISEGIEKILINAGAKSTQPDLQSSVARPELPKDTNIDIETRLQFVNYYKDMATKKTKQRWYDAYIMLYIVDTKFEAIQRQAELEKGQNIETTERQLRKNYKRLSLILHPDKCTSALSVYYKSQGLSRNEAHTKAENNCTESTQILSDAKDYIMGKCDSEF
jgi:ankyrin repeat protein